MSVGVAAEEGADEVGWGNALRRPIPSLLLFAGLTRVAITLVAWLAASYFGTGTGWNRGPGFIADFSRWDSGFYMDIAQLGYGFKPEAWSFNPGYPIVLGLVWRIVPGIDLPTAGFLVSNAAFFGAAVVLYKLGCRWFDERLAWRGAALFALLPGSFYLSAVYADALFCLLLCGALLLMAQRRWLWAGAVVSYAAITRPTGVFLLGAFGLALLIDAVRARKLRGVHVGAAALAWLGPALFALYSWRETGDALISMRSRAVYWPNVGWHNPLTIFDLSGVPPSIKVLVVGGIFALAIAMLHLLALTLVKKRWELVPLLAYTMTLGAVILSYTEANPVLRYLLAFPSLLWLLASVSASEGVFLGLAVMLGALECFVAIVFATWGPLY